MSTLLLIYLLSILLSLVTSDILWYYEMNTTIPNEWTPIGTINTYTSTQPNCPDNRNYCWSLQDESTLTLTPTSTAGYHTIRLTYAASVFNLNGQDRCTIQYTTDGTTSNYQPIIIYSSNTPTDTGIFNSWGTSANDNSNGISIQLQSTGNGQQCYFNHFIVTGTKITSQPTISPTLYPSLQPTTSNPTFTTTNPSKNPTANPTFTTLIPTFIPTPIPTDTGLFEEISPWEWPFSVPSIIIVYVIIAWFILFCCLRSWLLKLLLLIYGQRYESRVVGKRVTYSRKGGASYFLSYEICGTIRNKRIAVSTFNQFQEDMPIQIKYDPFCPTYNHKVYAYYNGWIVCCYVILIYLCMGGIAVAVLFGLGILNANKIQNAQSSTQEGAANYYEDQGKNYVYYNPQLFFYSICFGMFLCFLTIACQCACGQHCGKTKADLIDHSQAQNDENNQIVQQAQMMPVVYQPVMDPNQANLAQAHVQAPSIIYVQPAIQPDPNAPENVEYVVIQPEPSAPEHVQQVEGNESNVNDHYVE